jgi:hypothetical protein
MRNLLRLDGLPIIYCRLRPLTGARLATIVLPCPEFSSLSATGASQPLSLQLDRLLPTARSVVRHALHTARRTSVRTLVRAGLLASLLGAPLAQSTQFYNKGAEPGLPFSLAVRAGDYIFISGQLGIGPAERLRIGSPGKQAMENMARYSGP